MWRVLGNMLYDIEPQGQGQIIYFLVNASSLKPLDVEA